MKGEWCHQENLASVWRKCKLEFFFFPASEKWLMPRVNIASFHCFGNLQEFVTGLHCVCQRVQYPRPSITDRDSRCSKCRIEGTCCWLPSSTCPHTLLILLVLVPMGCGVNASTCNKPVKYQVGPNVWASEIEPRSHNQFYKHCLQFLHITSI